jgi:hypothetical protein
MLAPQEEVRYKLSQVKFKFDSNSDILEPCSFIGGAKQQVAVFQRLLPTGFFSYFFAQVEPSGVIRSQTYSFDSENDDYYFAVKPFSKIDDTYLCENIAFDKFTGRSSKAFCAISFDLNSDRTLRICYLNSELRPTSLITSDLIALNHGGILSIPELNQESCDTLDLQQIFGLEMNPEEFNFHAVRMDQSLTAVISINLDDLPIDNKAFIRVKVGEEPVALDNFYSTDQVLDSKLIGPEGEVFWGTMASKQNQFNPMLWCKSGIAQGLEVPAEFEHLKLIPVGISKSCSKYGSDRLVAYFEDQDYCHPITWTVDPVSVGEVPKLAPRNIVLDDMGAFGKIHDVSQYSGLIIATILPFGSYTPKKCILTPEIKI